MTWLDPREWPAPDYWCTICDRGAEGCQHEPNEKGDARDA